MKNNILLTLAIGALLVACGGAEADLEGSWKMHPSEIEKELGKKATPAQRTMMKQMLDKMKITFGDGKLTTPDGETYGYKVIESDGNDLTLEALDGKDKGDKIKITVDGDDMSMTHKGKTFKFLRAD